jgi:transposase
MSHLCDADRTIAPIHVERLRHQMAIVQTISCVWRIKATQSRLTCLRYGRNYHYTMIRRPSKPDPKLSALKRSGTVNAHAKDVQDPAFIDSEFFDPRDLIQVRYEMLRRVRSEGQPVTKATKLFGVSRPTFYKIQKDFDRSGLAGLLPAKRGPHGPRKITPEVMRFIEEVAAGGRDSDLTRLVGEIAQRFRLVVHPRTVARALARFKKKPR